MFKLKPVQEVKEGEYYIYRNESIVMWEKDRTPVLCKVIKLYDRGCDISIDMEDTLQIVEGTFYEIHDTMYKDGKPNLLKIREYGKEYRKKYNTYLDKVSKTLSYILRHKPEEFGITLDEHGYTRVGDIIDSLMSKPVDPLFIQSSEDMDRVLMDILMLDTKRYYYRGKDTLRWNRDIEVKANYGHSIKGIKKSESRPPAILYHGTSHKNYISIKDTGIKYMQRDKVHLSEDINVAVSVGKRRDNNPVILEVNTVAALKAGVKFYKEPSGVWLSTEIPVGLFKEVEVLE